MYHSLTFYETYQTPYGDGGVNTYEDFHLIPSTSTPRPVFDPPSVKTQIIDIPGADSYIDLSEALTKYPVYNNRQGSIEFIVLNGYEDWQKLYSRIMNYLHGRTKRVVMEDDPGYFYEGRFKVNKWKSNNDGTWSNITIDYDVQPYKLEINDTLDDWLWDPFNFDTGITLSDVYSNITIDSDVYVSKTFTESVKRKPISPEIEIHTTNSEGMTIQFINPELDIDQTVVFGDGVSYSPDFVMTNFSGSNVITMNFMGHGTVSMRFRNGEL